MDTCFNCGAAVRPGAKFCTSCGTRLIDNAEPASSTTAWKPSSSNGETQVATPAATSGTTQDISGEREDDASDDSPFASWKHASSGWNTPEDSSPADRFESGLGDGESSPAASGSGSASGWSAPKASSEEDEEDRFASWAAAYRRPDADETASTRPLAPTGDDSGQGSLPGESVTIPPTPDSLRSANGTEASGITGEGELQADLPATHENAGGPVSPGIADARARASSLIDELRSLVWNIGIAEDAGGKDVNLAVIVLAGARGKSGNYPDIRAALDAVKGTPRDLDALESLAARADRIEALLDDHTQLLDAIDEAIRELH